jgi:microcystin-dependent protein
VGTPYVGEIRMFGGNFAPAGWMFCEGQLLPISENPTLFNLVGTSFGGDGQSTFALPDLRGRVPIHAGGGFVFAEVGGVEAVTLNVQQAPAHSHSFAAANAQGNAISPSGALPANSFNVTPYINDVPDASMNALAITAAGGSQPHNNLQPYLCVSFIISLFGIFPSQN